MFKEEYSVLRINTVATVCFYFPGDQIYVDFVDGVTVHNSSTSCSVTWTTTKALTNKSTHVHVRTYITLIMYNEHVHISYSAKL